MALNLRDALTQAVGIAPNPTTSSQPPPLPPPLKLNQLPAYSYYPPAAYSARYGQPSSSGSSSSGGNPYSAGYVPSTSNGTSFPFPPWNNHHQRHGNRSGAAPPLSAPIPTPQRPESASDLAERTIVIYRPTSLPTVMQESEHFKNWLKQQFNVPPVAVRDVRVTGYDNYRIGFLVLDDVQTHKNIMNMYEQNVASKCYGGYIIEKAVDTIREGATIHNMEAHGYDPSTTTNMPPYLRITDTEEAIQLCLAKERKRQAEESYNAEEDSQPPPAKYGRY